MNTLTTLPINSADTPSLRSVLNKDGFAGNVIDLVPGAGFPEQDYALDHEQFLFVIQGEVTVSEGEVNTVLGRDQALLLPKGPNERLNPPILPCP